MENDTLRPYPAPNLDLKSWSQDFFFITKVSYILVLSQRVYKTKIRDVDPLREVLIAKWEEILQFQINCANNQFRPRFNETVQVKGKHIEQFFK